MFQLRLVQDSSPKIQIGRRPTESRAGTTSLPTIALGSPSGSGGSPRRNTDVLHCKKRALMAPDGSDVFSTVQSSQDCTRLWETYLKHVKLMDHFPATIPVESVAMNLLGQLKTTAWQNTFILIRTDRVTKMTRCISLRGSTEAVPVAAFLEYWVLPCSIASKFSPTAESSSLRSYSTPYAGY